MTKPGVADLLRLANGYQVSQAIHVAAVLGIADLFADAPRGIEELAEETGSHEESLYRLLRALAAVGVLREEGGRRFALADLGEPLRTGHPESVAGWAAFIGREPNWAAWGALAHSIRTGENAFRHVHNTDVWTHRGERRDESAAFDLAMSSLTHGVLDSVLEAFDFGRFRLLVDVGGGTGAFLTGILERYPDARGVLFDQAHVVQDAQVPDRCEVVAGSFFESVPAGGDAYLLKAIVHDWEDEQAIEILRSCAGAIAPGGSVLVVERLLGLPNEQPEAKFADLNMLVAPGGRERTLDEYATVFSTAGLRLVGETPTRSGRSVIEAVPADVATTA
jgi:O-methyltransferase domain/Dimerisation domain